MSTNEPARPQSRRTILAGLALGATVSVAPRSRASEPALDASETNEVDRLFRNWLALQGEMASATGYTDEWINGMDARAIAVEREIRVRPSSPMAAGALCLFALRYGVLFISTTPAELDPQDSADDDAWLALAVLPCLMPGLSGAVELVARDFMAHPDREVRHSLLFSGNERREA